MKILVCIKKIPDPEIPPSKFCVDEAKKEVIPPEGIPPVMNPYDCCALEIALRVKEKVDSKVIAISLDEEGSTEIIRQALAMGADEGILLVDKKFRGLDSHLTAFILSQTIKKIGDFDLILCGKQAADWEEGLVGALLAENLSLPLINSVSEVSYQDGEFIVKRVLLDGYQLISVKPPLLLTVSSEGIKARLPTGWGIIEATRKEIPRWGAAEIEAEPLPEYLNHPRRRLLRLLLPEKKRRCEILEGNTPEEVSLKLSERLRKQGLI